jgi:hypothetical protein
MAVELVPLEPPEEQGGLEHHRARHNEPQQLRFRLLPFDAVELNTAPDYLLKGWLPRIGLTVIWGPPKCGKSFWTFDLMMHVALGWDYRAMRVTQGPVVHVACEGADGFKRRLKAFAVMRLARHREPVPLYLVAGALDLVGDRSVLIRSIEAQIGAHPPACIVLDTLNRSLRGSESSDQDMSAYVKAADAIAQAFGCAVAIVHHCGIDGSRPRGHTALSGAVDAQIAISRTRGERIKATLELMKDGPEGFELWSNLKTIVVGYDDEGEPITSCVVEPASLPAPTLTRGPRLTPNQRAMHELLAAAGAKGLTTSQWNQLARASGIGTRRKATLRDLQKALHDKGLVHQTGDVWGVVGDQL